MSYIDAFAIYLRLERHYSEHTVIAYVNDVRQFFDFCGLRDEGIGLVSMNEVRAWFVMMMEAGGRRKEKLKAASGKRKLSSLRVFFRYLEKKGVVEKNPVGNISGPKLPKRLPIFVSERVMNEIFEEMGQKETFSGLRDLLIVLMMYETGMRRSELLNLRICDFDFERMCIRILGKGNKEREVPVLYELAGVVYRYLAMRNDLVGGVHDVFFVTNKGKPIYGEFVYRLVRKVLMIDESLERRSPHVLRHTFATHLLNNGASLEGIKDLLGHASIGATQVYTHNSVERVKKVFNQAHPRA